MPIDPSHQLVILARLSEFCQYRAGSRAHGNDPWGYMLRKLTETAEPLGNLKSALFAATKARLLQEMRAGALDAERYGDFRVLFERLLSPGDFADLAIHLSTDGDQKHRLAFVEQVLAQVRPHHCFVEEAKPAEERSPSWEKLIRELSARLDLERMGAVLKRKPKPGRRPGNFARRKSAVLRRVRRNVAEYCSVLHIPTDPKDTFTPFMLPRIEALIAANLRFLTKYR